MRIRAQVGLSQAEVAEKAGISRQGYRSLEAGSSEPRARTLEAIAAALRVPVEGLLGAVRAVTKVRFRADKERTTRNQVVADVSRWLEDYCEWEEQLREATAPPLRECPRRSSPEKCAGWARDQLGL